MAMASDNNNSLYFRRSTNNGAAWGSPVKLATSASATVPGNLQFGSETLAVGGNNIYVAFVTSDAKGYLRRSLDGGASFQTVQALGGSDWGVWFPWVTVDPKQQQQGLCLLGVYLPGLHRRRRHLHQPGVFHALGRFCTTMDRHPDGAGPQ